MRKLMAREPALQLNLLNKIAFDLREAQRRIMVLGQQNTYQRLASLLLDFAEHPAFYNKTHAEVALPLSRFDIADYLGTAPETVARGFLRLEREGLVRRKTTREIQIRDMDGLRRLRAEKRRADS
jgi:CRP-like cAMP-binding protein